MGAKSQRPRSNPFDRDVAYLLLPEPEALKDLRQSHPRDHKPFVERLLAIAFGLLRHPLLAVALGLRWSRIRCRALTENDAILEQRNDQPGNGGGRSIEGVRERRRGNLGRRRCVRVVRWGRLGRTVGNMQPSGLVRGAVGRRRNL